MYIHYTVSSNLIIMWSPFTVELSLNINNKKSIAINNCIIIYKSYQKNYNLREIKIKNQQSYDLNDTIWRLHDIVSMAESVGGITACSWWN